MLGDQKFLSSLHSQEISKNNYNYKHLIVTSVLSTAYGIILTRKIEAGHKNLEVEERAWFRAGRLTVVHLYCVIEIVENNAINYPGDPFAIWDFKNAFDNVPHTKLLKALKITNINFNLITTVQQKLYW